MKSLKKILTLLLITTVVGGGVYWYGETKADGADVSYRTAAVERGSLRSII